MAGHFSDTLLDQVRAASDIVDVISGVLPLKRSGGGFVALCPFHKEKTPSFHVNPQRQIFHCFGCHKGGDVFRFVQDYENISFPEAVQRLAERAHIPMEYERDEGAQRKRYLKDTLLQMHEGICQRWQAMLTNDAAGQVARDYLQRRGVGEEAIQEFRLGFAPESWDDTVNWARGKDYDLKTVAQAGLILHKEETDRYYDRFRGRLLFPICDEQGRVIGFSGRVLSGDEKTAKYVNSPETPIFSKGRVCYGLDKAKRALLDTGFAVICEGQLDLIACHAAGIRHCVAPQGTALTADHARVLRRYVEEVVLCFDSDTAGENAALRSLEDLLASGLAIRVAEIPAPDDPDSYIRKQGPEVFADLVNRAPGFFDYYLNLLSRRHDLKTDRGRLTVVRALGEAVAKTGSSVLLDTHAQKAAQRLGVATDSVRREFSKLVRRGGTSRVAPSGRTDSDSSPGEEARERPGNQEFWLLRLLLGTPSSLAGVSRHLNLDWIQHPGVRRVLEQLLTTHRAGAVDPASVVGQLANETDRSLATEALAEGRKIPNPEQQVLDLVRRLRDQQFERELARLSRELGREDLSDADRSGLLGQQLQLREQKRQPLEPPAT